VVETEIDCTMTVRQPTIFLDFSLAPTKTETPDGNGLPSREKVEQVLIEQALQPFLEEIQAQREKETEYLRHVEISLNELIHRQNLRMAELLESQQAGDSSPLLAAT